MNKSWAKKARGEFKEKEWKNGGRAFYRKVLTKSRSGNTYESIVPYNRLTTAKKGIHHDMVKYLQRIFSGGLFA